MGFWVFLFLCLIVDLVVRRLCTVLPARFCALMSRIQPGTERLRYRNRDLFRAPDPVLSCLAATAGGEFLDGAGGHKSMDVSPEGGLMVASLGGYVPGGGVAGVPPSLEAEKLCPGPE